MKHKKNYNEQPVINILKNELTVAGDCVILKSFDTVVDESQYRNLTLENFLGLKQIADNSDSTLEIQNIEAIINKNVYFKKRRFFHFIKRCFDIISSFLMIILLSPVFLGIAIAIKCDTKGPVIYKHKRLGKGQRKFNMCKFRSMRSDNRPIEEQLTPEQYREFLKEYKLDNDPRITKVGKFLRKTSLDELPQLFNILKGDMSFVGPRPIIERELEKYGATEHVLLSVRPGLTSYWACHGRSDVDYDRRINMELYYVKHRSLWFDFKILVLTAIGVLKKDGAK